MCMLTIDTDQYQLGNTINGLRECTILRMCVLCIYGQMHATEIDLRNLKINSNRIRTLRIVDTHLRSTDFQYS